MAACHTENTSCYLSDSAPRRRGLEQTLMAVVSEKGVCVDPSAFSDVCCSVYVEVLTLMSFWVPVGVVEEIERPLAQTLEGWVLQQAVSGLMLGGQLEQAEALCSQVGHEHSDTTLVFFSDCIYLTWSFLPTPPPTSQVLSVSPDHPAVLLSLRQVQCQRLLFASGGALLPDSVLEQLNNTVMMNPTNLGAWHVSIAPIFKQPCQCLIIAVNYE